MITRRHLLAGSAATLVAPIAVSTAMAQTKPHALQSSLTPSEGPRTSSEDGDIHRSSNMVAGAFSSIPDRTAPTSSTM